MEKKMFTLTYCYEGTDNTNPYATYKIHSVNCL